MKAAILVTLLVLLPGCAATPGNSDAARESWRGATYDEVVARWGAPARSTTLSDGRPVHTWISETMFSRGSVFPSIGIFGGSGGVGIGVGTSVGVGPGGYEQVQCERTLVFSNGRVAETNWQGSVNYCNEFRR